MVHQIIAKQFWLGIATLIQLPRLASAITVARTQIGLFVSTAQAVHLEQISASKFSLMHL